MTEPVHNSGYNAEEDHFHEQDREALEAIRAQLDEKRAVQKDSEDRIAHWMKCPKCGHDLEEIKLDVVMVDKCTACSGVFFDSGEVEMLLEANKKSAGFFGSLFG